MSENSKTIQFIDSNYRELFRIPDGGSITITYPPGDGREPVTRACKYWDDYHFETLGRGGDSYHIAQFAEIMERLGARYEPEIQLRDAELVPFSPGEERFFTYNREEGNTCIGHIAGDFGNDGERFYSSWQDRENGRNTPEFQAELYPAVYALRQSVLKDYDSMLAYCDSHPEAKLDSGDNYKRYGFKLETDSRQYFVNCFFGEYMRDARFIAYAYDKAAPVLEQEKENKQVYLHSEDIARENGELDLYRESLSLNMACALAIEDVIGRRYEANGYQYNPADIKGLIDKFGQERILAVLAHTVRETNDRRFSRSNRDWANEFPVPPRSKHASFTVSGHPAIVDGFIDQVRKPSVLDQIRTARKEQKQPSAPKPERDKKQRGPDL